MNQYPQEVRMIFSVASEVDSNVRVNILGCNEYEIYANNEMLYMNPNENVYVIRNEEKEDNLVYCNDFEEAIGKFSTKLIHQS